jgi:hypothetical protein
MTRIPSRFRIVSVVVVVVYVSWQQKTIWTLGQCNTRYSLRNPSIKKSALQVKYCRYFFKKKVTICSMSLFSAVRNVMFGRSCLSIQLPHPFFLVQEKKGGELPSGLVQECN